MMTAFSTAQDSVETSRSGVKILAGFTIAHGVFHFMQQSFAVMLPAIKETFGISAVAIGALMAAREIAMGLSSLPGGVLSDRLRHFRGMIMAACMAIFGLSWLLIGIAPIYPLLIGGMVFVAIATSVWHLPSIAEISQRFSHYHGRHFAADCRLSVSNLRHAGHALFRGGIVCNFRRHICQCGFNQST